MHIYIDESGAFVPGLGRSSLSAVGALVVPDARMSQVVRLYQRLRPSLPKERGEVKGRMLNEHQVSQVVALLAKNLTLFELVVMDTGAHNNDTVVNHLKAQAKGFVDTLTPQHSAGITKYAHSLKAALESVSPQLYLQAQCMLQLLCNTLETACNFYAQRWPRELAQFKWTIDGKEKNGITDWERWWAAAVAPMLQSISLQRAMSMMEGADWSHFQKFRMSVPRYIVPQFGDNVQKGGMDIAAITRDLSFVADPLPGLELIDILVNAMRRGMSGRLGDEGLLPIRSLMVNRRHHCFDIRCLADNLKAAPPPSLKVFAKKFAHGGRNMMIRR